MTKKSIYLKYREERDYAKYLKDSKKKTWQIKKVATVLLERVDLTAFMKPKQSVPVSLPIKYFKKIRSTMNNNNNHDGQKELQKPKYKIERSVSNAVRPIGPATTLRMVRHPGVAAQHDTTAGSTIIKSTPITRNAENNSKKLETYTPTNENNTTAKANVMPFRGDDHMNINFPDYPQKIDTAKKANVMPSGTAHRKINFTNSKEVGTNTSTDIISTGEVSNCHISIKHKLPVPVVPTKRNCGISREVSYVNFKHVGTITGSELINSAAKANERIPHIEVNSAKEVKRCLKALVITSTQTDKIPIVNEKELQILGIVTKSGVTNDELVDALESFKKVKELSKYNVTEVIDLDGSGDDNGAKLLELARFHSEKNKKAIYENRVRASNATTTQSAPTPIDLEQQKILEMRYNLIKYMNYEQLKNMIDSQDKNNNKENSHKKRKTTDSGDNYDETNMEMEIDGPETQTIMNQPVTGTAAPLPKPSIQKSTTQQRQMQQIKAQNKDSNMLQLHSTPLEQIMRQDAHLEYLQHQKMQQQQYYQALNQKHMRARTEQLQQERTQPPHSKSPQIQEPYSKSPPFQPPRSKSPQIREPYSKSPRFQQAHSKNPQIRELYSKSPQVQQAHSKSPQTREPYSKSPQFQQPHSKCPQIREPYSKNPQFQQPHSKSTQIREPYSKSPQIQEPQSKSPHDQHPASELTESQEQLQHPLDRRMRIRDQQRAALPQQHYQYESAGNDYQNPVFSQDPQTTNSTQQPQFQIYAVDPRIPTYQSQMAQAMPSAPRLMSTYQANLQTSRSSYPYQNNCYINQQYW